MDKVLIELIITRGLIGIFSFWIEISAESCVFRVEPLANIDLRPIGLGFGGR